MFAHDFDWYRDRMLDLGPSGGDEFDAVCNTLRFMVGMPPVGHRMTYDFWFAMESVRRYRSRWEAI